MSRQCDFEDIVRSVSDRNYYRNTRSLLVEGDSLAACRRGIRERQNLVKLTIFFIRNGCKKERKGVIGSVREAKSTKKERKER